MADELSHKDKVAIERGNFRGRLQNTAAMPDFVKLGMISVHLKDNLVLGGYAGIESDRFLLPLAELFKEVFGSEGTHIFWQGKCSIIQPMLLFVDLFWLTHESSDMREDSMNFGLQTAILIAYQMGEDWIVADPRVFVGIRFGSQIRVDQVNINVRRAALWLLDKPQFAHLVPKSLRDFLISCTTPDRKKPSQPEVTAWMISFHKKFYDAGKLPPKQEPEVFPACKHDTHATQAQMKVALKKVLPEHKRGKGIRDR